MQFRHTCEGLEGQQYEDLIHLIDTAEKISADEFYDLVEEDDFLPYFEEEVGKISEDSMIHCYKGELQDGTPACYFDYSRIEHVFY